jgi:hypothetical protein
MWLHGRQREGVDLGSLGAAGPSSQVWVGWWSRVMVGGIGSPRRMHPSQSFGEDASQDTATSTLAVRCLLILLHFGIRIDFSLQVIW